MCFIRRGRRGEFGWIFFNGDFDGERGRGEGRAFLCLDLAPVVEKTDSWSNTGWCNLRRGDRRGGYRGEAGRHD